MPTAVGLLHLKLHVPEAMTLKDKRRAIKSFKDRTANAFNVSISEVDFLDNHRMALLAVAVVGNDKTYLEGSLQRIINAASMHKDMILIESQVDWL